MWCTVPPLKKVQYGTLFVTQWPSAFSQTRNPPPGTDLLELGQLDTLVCWKMGGGGPKSNFWWENDDKPPGFVRHICNQTLLVVDQNQCALIFTSTWFDCIKAQPQIYGIIHRPWPIPRISHCSLLISKRNPSRLFAQKRCNFCHAVAPGLFHHRATVVIWGHNPPHRPPTVPVQW